jgi:hypothetical protein
MAVPVSTSWSADGSGTATHYDLKDLSSTGDEMTALMQQHAGDVGVATAASASMPSIVDLQHHHDQRQLQQQQQIFLNEQVTILRASVGVTRDRCYDF